PFAERFRDLLFCFSKIPSVCSEYGRGVLPESRCHFLQNGTAVHHGRQFQKCLSRALRLLSCFGHRCSVRNAMLFRVMKASKFFAVASRAISSECLPISLDASALE